MAVTTSRRMVIICRYVSLWLLISSKREMVPNSKSRQPTLPSLRVSIMAYFSSVTLVSLFSRILV
jgi:hypothetical protein